jgi:uncharacterized membrane protein YeiH
MKNLISPDVLITVVEVAAVVAFAISGFIEAIRKRMDAVGIFAVAFLAAFGGGTLRDILIDRRPFFWVEHQEYVILTFLLPLVAMPLLRARHVRFTERAIQIPDALGLGLFSVVGTSQALDAGLPGAIAVMMGVVTAVFGGVLRDVVCNEIPVVFHDRRPYALCAFAGSLLFLALYSLGVPQPASLAGGMSVTAGLRLVALARAWKIPPWPPD